MKKTLLFFLFAIYLQVSAQVGIGTTNVNQDAQLELLSPNQGMLVPRLNLTNTNLPTPLINHISGMVVYNLSNNGNGTTRVVEGLYYNDGSKWILLIPNLINIGDIKHSFALSDHNGWYLLDGRNINLLPIVAKNNAISLGLTTNLIDASDLYLKAKNSTDTILSVNGQDSFSISQNNLPNVNFLGTTSIDGNHTHQVDSYLGFQNIGLLSTSALTLFSVEQIAKDETLTTNKTTEVEGNHSHSVIVNSGGGNVPVERKPSYLNTNIFIYLGI